MPGIKNVTKHLLTQEDIAYGEGTIDQTRGGIDFELNKVRTIVPVNSLDELNALDTTKFLKAVLFSAGFYTFYSYLVGTWQVTNVATTFVQTVPPVSSTSAGAAGQVTWDSSYLYVCVAINTWKRVAIGTW